MLNPEIKKQLDNYHVIKAVTKLAEHFENLGQPIYVFGIGTDCGVIVPDFFVRNDSIRTPIQQEFLDYIGYLYENVLDPDVASSGGVLSYDDIDEKTKGELIPLWV